MAFRRMRLMGLLLVVSILGSSATARGGDLPAYKADASRSSVSNDALRFGLSAAWTHRPAQRPVPVWPEPGRAVQRIDFDYAFHPVIAGGLVYFASSADDSARAIDQATGQEKSCFTTDAPARFAPQIVKGRCYFAGDDGLVYCLDATDGTLIWKVAPGGKARMAVGNGRMISRAPCRSGVLVTDGVLHVTARMWPSEGVVVCALEAKTGKTIWCNDTTPSDYRAWPHRRSLGFGGPSPQGYLLANDDTLIVTCGKAVRLILTGGRAGCCTSSPSSPTSSPAGHWRRWTARRCSRRSTG